MYSIEWLGANGERLEFQALDTASDRFEAEAQAAGHWQQKAKIIGATDMKLYENGATEPFWSLRNTQRS